MKNNFDIYLLGLTLSQNTELIKLLEKSFNVNVLSDLKNDLTPLRQSLLIVFDHRLSEKVIKLKTNHIKKMIPLIAYIDCSVEPESTKLSLLESGIDDIILLEMSIEEQVARIKKIVQIYLKTTQKLIKVSDIILDQAVQIGTYKDDNLNLSKIEFEILYALFKNFKVEISREKLSKTIWEKQSPNNLNKHLSNIKKKIEHTPIEIISRRGKGITVRLKNDD